MSEEVCNVWNQQRPFTQDISLNQHKTEKPKKEEERIWISPGLKSKMKGYSVYIQWVKLKWDITLHLSGWQNIKDISKC